MAPGGLEIRVDGLEKVLRELHGVEVELEDLREVMQKAADLGARLAAQAAPKESGQLAGSITGQVTGANRAEFGTDLVYAGAINFGWPDHNIGGAEFLQRAQDDLDGQLTALLTKEIERLIREKGLS